MKKLRLEALMSYRTSQASNWWTNQLPENLKSLFFPLWFISLETASFRIWVELHASDKPGNQGLEKIETYSKLSCAELIEGNAFRFPALIRYMKAAINTAIMIVCSPGSRKELETRGTCNMKVKLPQKYTEIQKCVSCDHHKWSSIPRNVILIWLHCCLLPPSKNRFYN